MRYFETVTPEPREYEREFKRVCDLCKREIPTEAKNRAKGIADHISMRKKTGYVDREGGSGKTVEVDCCIPCWDEKVVPWLRAQGAELTEKDWDW